jgi:hypothetical protein
LDRQQRHGLECFKLATDDDFIIVYGVNNTQTEFATFINVSLYGDELWNGVAGTVFTDELQYPADEYFPEGDKNSRYYYVVKMARRATERIRMYLNQKTKVTAAPFDIIWGHAILFSKKKRLPGLLINVYGIMNVKDAP